MINDKQLIEDQLGRKVRGEIEIVSFCKTNPRLPRICGGQGGQASHPQVIKTLPLLDGKEPFPTLYYLTCPYLVKEVGRLEGDGYIERFEEEINCNPKLKEEFLKAQKSYIAQRRELISPGELANLSQDQKETILNKGIAGVYRLASIKCLHAQYAHFLATGNNPIGKKINIIIKQQH